MSEDWRLTLTLEAGDGGRGDDLLRALHEYAEELEGLPGRRVAVSGEGGTLFFYADGEEPLREAERVARGLLTARGASGRFELARWHPLAERWEDPSLPLPRTEAEERAERERLAADEAAESEALGPEWEVRVELPDHAETVELARRLEQEGVPAVRRWRYLLVGAETEEAARELARRLADEAPPGARLEVEASGGAVWRAVRPNPFAVFGGLGA